MTDYRSVEQLIVYRSGVEVGTLRRLQKGSEFRYSEAFLGSSQSPVAIHLPKTPEGIKVEGILNLPTYFAGLLPEGVMYSAIVALIGSAVDDLFAVLAATGADAIGDIDVRIPGQSSHKPELGLAEAAELIGSLLNRNASAAADRITAVPGAQPKLSIGGIVRSGRKAGYIVKFNPPEYPGLIKNEFACMNLARHCGIRVPRVRIDQGALIVTRFDRLWDKRARLLRKLHVEDMCQVMDLFPNAKYAMEYSDLLTEMAKQGVSKPSLLDAIRLYVYSYIIGNGDLHAKNVSLMRDEVDGQWRLSPGYDLLSTLPYADQLPGAARMALALADESFGRFTVDEFTELGSSLDLPSAAVRRAIASTASAVLKNLYRLEEHGFLKDVLTTISGRARSLGGLVAQGR